MKKILLIVGMVAGFVGVGMDKVQAQLILPDNPSVSETTAILPLPSMVTDLDMTAPAVPAAAPALEVVNPVSPKIEGPETFFRSTPANFSKAVLKFNAVTLDDSRVVDDYARIAYCDLARRYMSNEFEWTKIRTGIRKSVDLEKNTYPYRFVYTDQIQLGNYDFDVKGFLFSTRTPLKGIGNIVIEGGIENGCITNRGLQSFPTRYRIIFAKPITLDMLPMSQADGQRLLARMKTRGNTRRVVYIRFNFEVQKASISDVLTDPNFAGGEMTANFQSRLHSIDFFEDKDEKMLIGSWKPQN